MPRNQAIVAIPIHKPSIDELELFSLARCSTVLGHHPTVWICSHSIDLAPYEAVMPHARALRFDDRYFRSLAGYSELLVSPHFYAAFEDSEFMLIYQPDAFVFEDRLHYWCSRGYDYIGAPWVDRNGNWNGVGNGGFSLRSIESCLKVLRDNPRLTAGQVWNYLVRANPNPLQRMLRLHGAVLAGFGIRNDQQSFLRRWIARGEPEDVFWGVHAPRSHSNFNVAPLDEAIAFAVEASPEKVTHRYAERPPFGCHRTRFLVALHRYLETKGRGGDLTAGSDFERAVWAIAEVARLA